MIAQDLLDVLRSHSSARLLALVERIARAGDVSPALAVSCLLQVLVESRNPSVKRRALTLMKKEVSGHLDEVLVDVAEIYVRTASLSDWERTRIRGILRPYRDQVREPSAKLLEQEGTSEALELVLWSRDDGHRVCRPYVVNSKGELRDDLLDWRDVLTVFGRSGLGGQLLEEVVEATGCDTIRTQLVDGVGDLLRQAYLRSRRRRERSAVEWLARIHVRNADSEVGNRARHNLSQVLGSRRDRILPDCTIDVDCSTVARALVVLPHLDSDERREVLTWLALAPSKWEDILYSVLHPSEAPSLGTIAADHVEQAELDELPVFVALLCADLISPAALADSRHLIGVLQGRTQAVMELLDAVFPEGYVDLAHRKFAELLGALLSYSSGPSDLTPVRVTDADQESLLRSLEDYQSLRRERGLPFDAQVEQWLAINDDETGQGN